MQPFCTRRGFFRAKCRTDPVQRFRCRRCRRSFSTQTFSHSYRDRRPECNEALFRYVVSGTGLRQAGRMLELDIRAVQQKLLKIGRTCRLLHANLSSRLPNGRTYLMDEEETYEGASIRPLTVPLLIERDTWFLVAATAGPIRRLAPEGTRRRALQERDEERSGRRPDTSRACIEHVLRDLAKRTAGLLALLTDEKPSYGAIARRVLRGRVEHRTTPGTARRDAKNPLFPINTTIAMTRDNCGRLRRRSWLVTKKCERLQNHLHLFAVYRNYIRCRFNKDRREESSAVLLGLLPRALSFEEVLRWRQDWGELSSHPLRDESATIAGCAARSAATTADS